MDNTGKELLETPFPQEPKGLFDYIQRLLARLDALRHESTRYLHGFKPAESELSTFDKFELRIVEGLSELFLLSYNTDFFWYDCPLQVYKNTLPARLEKLKVDDPELSENALLLRDYQALDILPLYGQRFLRTDEVYVGIDYGRILEKGKKKERSQLNQKAEQLRFKLERSRGEKMDFIQQQFMQQGSIIIKNGEEFELKNLPNITKVVEIPEKHSHIFSNNGFKLFEHLLKNYIPENRGRFYAVAYYFRRMKEDKYIHATEKSFLEWFSEVFEEELGARLKPISDTETDDKKHNYSNALEWHKH